MPILHMSKKKKALELRGFHADVLRLLKHWATDTGVEELMARSGELAKQAYPDSDGGSDWPMEAVVAAHDTDEDVRMLLQGCCEAGVDVWERHAAGSLDGVSAKEVTVGEQIRAGMVEGNNDTSERNMGMLRYLRTHMHRLRVAGKEALLMLRTNKPLQALKSGQIGEMCKVFALARRIARDEKKAAGPIQKERQQEGAEVVAYRAANAPRPSQNPKAMQALKTKNTNDALKATMSRDVENTLLISDDEIMAKTDPELKVLIGAWALVPPTQFKGQLWPGAKFPKGTGSKGSLKKAEKQEALKGVMKAYGDAMRAAM